MKLSPTAYVILGFLEARPRSGYDIKQTVEHSTRFFWKASYGQIYPELKRLEAAGLAKGRRDDTGARRRIRYEITAAGRKALHGWLRDPPEVDELRDEWLLKLFFSMRADPGTGPRIMADLARRHGATRERLEQIEPQVEANDDPHQLSVLRYGIALNAWAEGYCAAEAKSLTDHERLADHEGRRHQGATDV